MSKICAELPHTKSGKIKIEQFMKLPILSEEAFKAIDKNRFARCSQMKIMDSRLFRCNIASLALMSDTWCIDHHTITKFHKDDVFL